MNILPPSVALSLFLSGLVSFSFTLCLFLNVPECIYFSWRQKSEWHIVVPQSESSDMVIKSLLLYKHWLIKTHTHKLLHPQLNNANKKPFLIKATSLNTRSILCSLSRRSTPIQIPFFPSSSPTCPFV